MSITEVLAISEVEPESYEQDGSGVDEYSEYREATMQMDGTPNALQLFLNRASEFELLTAAQEVELAKQKDVYMPFRLTKKELEGLPSGETQDTVFAKRVNRIRSKTEREAVLEGKEAFDLMLNSNLRLVVSIAKNYLIEGMTLMDLIQEGYAGLNRAVEKFDWTKGWKFSTYATYWIRQAVSRGIDNHSRVIRHPVHVADMEKEIYRAEQAFFLENRRDPTKAEIADATGLPLIRVKEALGAAAVVASLDKTFGDDGETTLADFASDENVVDFHEDASRNEVSEAVGKNLARYLTEKQLAVIELKFGLIDGKELELKEIGQRLGITHQRVVQISDAALKKLATVPELQRVSETHEVQNGYHEAKEELSEIDFAAGELRKLMNGHNLRTTESRVLLLLCRGYERGDIIDELNLSKNTVSASYTSLRKKFGSTEDAVQAVKSKAQALQAQMS